MPSIRNRKPALRPAGIAVAVVGVLAAVLALNACGDPTGSAGPLLVKPAAPVESFTFLDMGAGTRFSKGLRRSLSEKLGSDAIETKGTIDLKTLPRGLLEARFPSLDALQRGLNSAQGARVEHAITRLTYRYPDQRNTWFQFGELVFSNYTGRPLYFRLTLNKEGAATLETIRRKYGEPETLSDVDPAATVFSWEKNGDMLIVTKVKDRFGDPLYHVMFYFTANLRHMLDEERAQVEKRERALKQAGKTAF